MAKSIRMFTSETVPAPNVKVRVPDDPSKEPKVLLVAVKGAA